MKPLFIAAMTCAALAGCEVAPVAPPTPLTQGQGNGQGGVFVIGPAPSTAEADAFAVAYLETMQARSFRNNSEYCGYFFVDADGTIRADTPTRGDLDSCPRTQPPSGVFAGWHTHGAYHPDYDNEVPSPNDMIGTFQSGFDGYLSTPGGRVWRIETDNETALQICSQGCVSVDPGFVPVGEAGIRQSYTFQALLRRIRGGDAPERRSGPVQYYDPNG